MLIKKVRPQQPPDSQDLTSADSTQERAGEGAGLLDVLMANEQLDVPMNREEQLHVSAEGDERKLLRNIDYMEQQDVPMNREEFFGHADFQSFADVIGDASNHLDFRHAMSRGRAGMPHNIGFDILFSKPSLNDGLCGLQNIGNTCFLNSVIQCLSSITTLTEYFRSGRYLYDVERREQVVFARVQAAASTALNSFADDLGRPKLFNRTPPYSNPRAHLARAYGELLREMWDTMSTALRPYKLKYTIGGLAPRFSGFQQQDAQELMSYLLDCLHKDLTIPPPPRPTPSPSSPDVVVSGTMSRKTKSSLSSTDERTGGGSLDEGGWTMASAEEGYVTADSGNSTDSETDEKQQLPQSIISFLFDGDLLSSVKCLHCGNISCTRETFQTLSLSIPDPYTQQWQQHPMTPEDSNDCEQQQEGGSDENNNDENRSSSSAVVDQKQDNGGDDDANKRPRSEVSTGRDGFAWWIYALTRDMMLTPIYDMFAHFYRQLFMEGCIPLEACLNVFFSPDHLRGDNMYSCDHCKMLRNGIKQCALVRCPEVLCIHLKRFRHDIGFSGGGGSSAGKLNTRVTFPLCNLDLRTFLANINVPAAAVASDENARYDLIGLISHRGSSIDYGHYVAYCRRDSTGAWYEFDDSVVTRVSEMEVNEQEAYVLLYQRLHES